MAHLKRMETPLRYLTKSLVRKALSCPRKLVYATNPDFAQNCDLTNDPMLQHLSNEGERFGDYCRGLFPNGIEIGKNHSFERIHNAPMSHADLIDETNRLLMDEEKIILFEGAVRHGLLFARPDILIKSVDNETNQTELKIVEVKSKSWDARHTVESKMLTLKNSIRSTFLPYIQDIAFQTLILQNAFPDFRISSWLMMPDRAKKLKEPFDKNGAIEQSIDDSVASIVNVDDLVNKVLTGKIPFPGSKRSQYFTKMISIWSEAINTERSELDSSLSSPIGSQCMSCEYRLNKADEMSGFDLCWQSVAKVKKKDILDEQLVTDIYSPTKRLISKLLKEDKYTFTDLGARDFGLNDEGIPLRDNKSRANSEDKIYNSQRQWFQVNSVKSQPATRKKYIMKAGLVAEMDKWQYPLHLIDFETISPALPYFSGMSPYDIVCFQFSHHVLEWNEDRTSLLVRHESEFIHTTPTECPNAPFLKALHKALGHIVSDGGTVFCWSSHEKTVLKSILFSPEFSASLSQHEIESLSALLPNGSHQMVDLFQLAREYFYVDGSGGSSSIKRLLQPTLNASKELKRLYSKQTYNSNNFRNLQWYQVDEYGNAIDPYDILSRLDTDKDRSAITVGGAAAAAYHTLQSQKDMSEEDRKQIHSSLLRYCELDTLSMVSL